VIDGAAFPSTTTIIGVLAKPGLASWARRTVIETLRTLLADGVDVEEALRWAEGEPERQRDAAALRGASAHEAIALALAGEPYSSEWEP
jgi:hypothetical protein